MKKQRSFENLLNLSSLSAHRNAIYGFAALWIVFFHYVDMSKIVKPSFPKSLDFLWDTFQMGNIGVDIFLFLSGVGLYYSFQKDNHVLRFYYKRLIRILVPFVLICVPYMTYLYVSGGMPLGDYIQQITNVAFWTGHATRLNLWYVPAILVLYLVYPLIYKFLFGWKKGALLRCLVLIAVTVAATFLLWKLSPTFLYKRYDKFLPRIAPFLLGCWIGKPVKEKKDFSPWVIAGAVAVVFFAYPLYTRGILKGPFSRYYGCLTGVAMTFLLAQFFELVKSIRIDRFFAFFGGFSLEIYLLHIEARNWYTHSAHYGEHPLRWYSLLALGAILLAFLISLLEKPIVKLLLKPVQKKKKADKAR